MQRRELAVALDWIRAHAGDPRRAAHGRRSARLLRRPARLAARRAARHPPRRDPPPRHAAAGDAARSASRRSSARMLERHHPLWVNTHFNHPKELTAEAAEALRPPRGARASRSATRACSSPGINDDVDDDEGALRGARAACACGPTTATRRSSSRAPRTSACRSSAASSSSARCAGAPAASRSRSTCSTRPTARCRSAYPYLRGREGDDVVVETSDGRLWRELNPRLSGAADAGSAAARPHRRSPRRCSRAACCSRACSGSRATWCSACAVGAGREADAYNAAFQLPDLLNYFLAGGALSIAFVPALDARARAGTARPPRRGSSRTCSARSGSRWRSRPSRSGSARTPLVALQFPRFDAGAARAHGARSRASCCRRRSSSSCGGVVQAVLMAQGRFAAQARGARCVYNLGIIARRPAPRRRRSASRASPGARSLGAVVGAVRCCRCSTPAAACRCGLRVAPLDPGFAAYLAVAAPLMVGRHARSPWTSGTRAGSASSPARARSRRSPTRAG